MNTANNDGAGDAAIAETERVLHVRLPPKYRARILAGSGGEVSSLVGDWTLFGLELEGGDEPRLGIVAGTRSAQEWRGFPEDAVAIGFNALGDYILLRPRGRKQRLDDVVFWWDHETCDVEVLADSIDELPDAPP